jgi:hypothetical protein
MNYVRARSKPAGVGILRGFSTHTRPASISGRLRFKNGLDRIVRIPPPVARCYPDVMLTIVGEGDASFEGALRNSIAVTIRCGESDSRSRRERRS